MAADHLVFEAEPLEQPDRLAVLARGDLDLVPRFAQALDDRPEDERMRRGSAVDPDPHVPKLTGRPAGLIGWGYQQTQRRSTDG